MIVIRFVIQLTALFNLKESHAFQNMSVEVKPTRSAGFTDYILWGMIYGLKSVALAITATMHENLDFN